MVASGLCHSDDHHATGDMRVGILPFAGGHEGACVVESVGPHTPGFAEDDHVVFSFLPSCGRCRWCATGHQNLCDMGALKLDELITVRYSLDDIATGSADMHAGRNLRGIIVF
ncbi:alcohol dehydrogenase catalytic domain-containing protein [Pseudonocardia abyssalis]|uniref:alcohol dehydrogenase catalytic domain-containing protein n=1 Tax=Pseudonocardia abyssalis TaxID=2792008 RepID=UPI00226B2BB6|nr:alcohol dehydrogenase catalytic domain-containing protein [Pseudonocardia abyssalis]